MPKYRDSLPQLSGDLFLTDAGLETDLIFNHGIEIRNFAAYTLLSETKGRTALTDYFHGFLTLAETQGTGFILDSPTFKAHLHWAVDHGATESGLEEANREAIRFTAALRDEFAKDMAIVLNGAIGPCGDAYARETTIAVNQAEAYHATQIGWFAKTEVDMVTATSFNHSDEASGFARAAKTAGLPSVVSFTTETDGHLPKGQSLKEAIEAVDEATQRAPAYFMINCAHPDHFSHVLDGADWARRIRGIRCNASTKSHAELDQSETLEDGDPAELAAQYKEIRDMMPWMNIFGACCGADLRHVTEIAHALNQ